MKLESSKLNATQTLRRIATEPVENIPAIVEQYLLCKRRKPKNALPMMVDGLQVPAVADLKMGQILSVIYNNSQVVFHPVYQSDPQRFEDSVAAARQGLPEQLSPDLVGQLRHIVAGDFDAARDVESLSVAFAHLDERYQLALQAANLARVDRQLYQLPETLLPTPIELGSVAPIKIQSWRWVRSFVQGGGWVGSAGPRHNGFRGYLFLWTRNYKIEGLYSQDLTYFGLCARGSPGSQLWRRGFMNGDAFEVEMSVVDDGSQTYQIKTPLLSAEDLTPWLELTGDPVGTFGNDVRQALEDGDWLRLSALANQVGEHADRPIFQRLADWRPYTAGLTAFTGFLRDVQATSPEHHPSTRLFLRTLAHLQGPAHTYWLSTENTFELVPLRGYASLGEFVADTLACPNLLAAERWADIHLTTPTGAEDADHLLFHSENMHQPTLAFTHMQREFTDAIVSVWQRDVGPAYPMCNHLVERNLDAGPCLDGRTTSLIDTLADLGIVATNPGAGIPDIHPDQTPEQARDAFLQAFRVQRLQQFRQDRPGAAALSDGEIANLAVFISDYFNSRTFAAHLRTSNFLRDQPNADIDALVSELVAAWVLE